MRRQRTRRRSSAPASAVCGRRVTKPLCGFTKTQELVCPQECEPACLILHHLVKLRARCRSATLHRISSHCSRFSYVHAPFCGTTQTQCYPRRRLFPPTTSVALPRRLQLHPRPPSPRPHRACRRARPRPLPPRPRQPRGAGWLCRLRRPRRRPRPHQAPRQRVPARRPDRRRLPRWMSV